jgi:hypothetical protein
MVGTYLRFVMPSSIGAAAMVCTSALARGWKRAADVLARNGRCAGGGVGGLTGG